MELNKLGITKENDSEKEEYIYSIGSQGNIPIALFLLIASGYKNAIARYFNQITHSEQAEKWQNQILRDKIIVSKEFENSFEGVVKNTCETKPLKLFNLENLKPASDDWQQRMMNPPHDTPLPLYLYAQEFAKLTCMATPSYESGCEGTIMTCPMSYINFWGRKEFTELDIALNTARQHVLDEVLRILAIREMSFNEKDMTIYLPQYKGYQFVYSYAW